MVCFFNWNFFFVGRPGSRRVSKEPTVTESSASSSAPEETSERQFGGKSRPRSRLSTTTTAAPTTADGEQPAQPARASSLDRYNSRKFLRKKYK